MADYRPQTASPNRRLALYTFKDAVDDLIDAFDGDGAGKQTRDAKRAVLEALRDLPGRHSWQYYRRIGHVTTAASQSDGTVAYDHTGGTYERQLTLTGATWPDEARFYRLAIDGVIYDVEDRKSSTVITLTVDSNPGADVASGTEYELFRSCYPVPMDFRKASGLMEVGESNWPTYVAPEVLLEDMDSFWEPVDTPNEYTIRGGGEHYGGLVIEFGPPPSTARTYSFVYDAEPFMPRIFGADMEYKEGTVAVSSVTVTGTSTTWTSDMVGCVIRFPFSGGSGYPTGLVGNAANDQPYAEQATIQAVASATSLTIDHALTGTYSGVNYTIGSPLDMDPVMYPAFQRLAEYNYALRQKDRKDSEMRYGRFVLALKAAMAAANKQRSLEPEVQFYAASLADIARD